MLFAARRLGSGAITAQLPARRARLISEGQQMASGAPWGRRVDQQSLIRHRSLFDEKSASSGFADISVTGC